MSREVRPPTPAETPHAWDAVEPAEAATWLARVDVPWWIAGGWALDLFLGERTRAHGDLDVGVLRRDIGVVLAVLADWEHWEARNGALIRLDRGASPSRRTHSLWSRPRAAANWTLEILLDESEGDLWLFRREPSIRRPLSTVARRGAGGIRFLAPEVQLLYKAKAVRDIDQTDFDRVAPGLEAAARSWLRQSLSQVHPGHVWLPALERPTGDAPGAAWAQASPYGSADWPESER